MELVDIQDLKSWVGNDVPVRFRPWALFSSRTRDDSSVLFTSENSGFIKNLSIKDFEMIFD